MTTQAPDLYTREERMDKSRTVFEMTVVDGESLKWIRRQLNLTQPVAAEKVGVSKRTWIRWETGKFNPSEEYRSAIEALHAQACEVSGEGA